VRPGRGHGPHARPRERPPGVSAALPQSAARFSLTSRPLFDPTHPVPEEVLGIAGLG